MMLRRSFLAYGVGMMAALAAPAQNTALQGGKAIVCTDEVLTCPNGHKTCPTIDAHLAIGNDNRNYPETSVLFDYRLERCNVCRVLFTRE